MIWTARHWSPFLELANHLGERQSVSVLMKHGIYAGHCGGYDVHAWPCPTAALTLEHIAALTP